MIPKYIENWLTIIEQMNNDNTYKLAWGRAIVECVCFKHYREKDSEIVIPFNEISRCMLKYYWNQLFFFKLNQSPYKDKNPVICQDTNALIDNYKKLENTNIPIWYDEEKLLDLDKDFFNKTIAHISKTLHENVCWRFLNVVDGTLEVYRYTKGISSISINKEDAVILEEYGVIVSKLLNYKWTQLLEKFNFQPKIATKVSAVSENKIRRNSLTKYREELLKEHNGTPIDFYSGKVISQDDISVDHVLPWSFMYSDDIWNLVITSKSQNSSKSNSIPDKEVIEKLIERNNHLKDCVSATYKKDIENSLENNLLNKLYFDCRL